MVIVSNPQVVIGYWLFTPNRHPQMVIGYWVNGY
jgi:hypothetical protein